MQPTEDPYESAMATLTRPNADRLHRHWNDEINAYWDEIESRQKENENNNQRIKELQDRIRLLTKSKVVVRQRSIENDAEAALHDNHIISHRKTETKAMTYAQLAKSRHTKTASAKKLAQEQGWARHIGDDGLALVDFPVEFLKPKRRIKKTRH
jgi:hypothetical protein